MNESSNKQASGASVVLHSLEKDKVKCMIRLDFLSTNNKAEYEALIMGLDLAKAPRAANMIL